MKLWHFAVWCSAIGLGLTACSESKSTENKIASAPAAPTVYRVATDPTYPPFEFAGEQGKMQGLDIDILTAIAKNQQFEIQFYAQKWDVLLNELPSNRADMVTGALIASDINSEQVALSEPYMQSKNCVASIATTPPDNWQGNSSIAIANNESLHQRLIAQYGVQESQLQRHATPFAALKAVVGKEANVIVSDCAVLSYHMTSNMFKSYPLKRLALANQSDADINLVFAVNPQQPELLAKINAGIQQIKQNGELKRILHKWYIQP